MGLETDVFIMFLACLDTCVNKIVILSGEKEIWKRKKKNYCKKHIFEITKEKYLRTETYDYNVKKDYYAIYSKCLLCKEEKIEEFPRNKRIDMNGYEARL